MFSIYALKDKGEVVYVGMSKNVNNRIKFHKKHKEFDSYEILEFEIELKNVAFNIEDSYIKYYDPKYNKKLNSHGYYVKLKEETKNKKYDLYKVLCEINRIDLKPIFKDNYPMIMATVLECAELHE